MRKKITIESYERDFILNLHNKEKLSSKKFLTEQKSSTGRSVSQATEFFKTAQRLGCLKNPNLEYDQIYKDNEKDVFFISTPQEGDTNKVLRVYEDFTFDWIKYDPLDTSLKKPEIIKSGFWSCDQISEEKFKKYLDQGYKQFKDILFKPQSGNTEFYEQIKVGETTLFKPVYDYYSQVGVQQNYPLGSPQRDFLNKLETAGYVVNPDREDRTFMDLQPSTDVKVDANLFPKGLEVYTNLKNTKKAGLKSARQTAKSLKYEPKTCEEAVELYWNRYKDHLPGSGPEFEQLKSQVQNCLYQNMYRWKDIGGVLGIGGGANHLDKILELFTGKSERYKGVTRPPFGTPYSLKPSRQQKR